MTKLTDLQSLLLATAASRDSGSLVPLPSTIKAPAGGVAKPLAALVRNGFAEEREITDAALVHRKDGDLRFGLFITAAGMQAIGVEDAEGRAVEPTSVAPAPAPERNTKAAAVLALLQRAEGATVRLLPNKRKAVACSRRSQTGPSPMRSEVWGSADWQLSDAVNPLADACSCGTDGRPRAERAISGLNRDPAIRRW